MKKLSPSTARFVMAIAALVGLFASMYLLYTYVSGAPITCGSSGGCEIVRLSRWAYTFGIPRPLLGVVFYVGVFGLLVARSATEWHARWLYRLTMLAAAVGFIESGFLFFVQWLDIKAFCLWCLLSACASIVIASVAWFDEVEEHRSVSAERELRRYFFALLAFLPIVTLGLGYLITAREASGQPVLEQTQ